MRFDDLRRPPLDRAALTAALTGGASIWRAVEVVDESPSTNGAVSERARTGEPEGLVLVAEHQTEGRGRLDRSWITPARAALTFSSLLVPQRVPPARWPWLPLLAGIAVAEGIRRVTDVPCALKWPNDVMVDDRKLAGLLVERVERPGSAAAVLGVGINVSSTRDELPVPTATSLELAGASTLDRSVILREVLRALEALYLQWSAERGDPDAGLHAAYVRRCATIGRQVRVELPSGDPVLGEAVGVDGDGRLQVRTAAGSRLLGAGDVVHVRPEPGPGT
ncbi:MAG TPA: biotin--[acetyl-CoA-carboxylase] ligase [Nocardioidaceae bacterium]|nr:biotin--[acetyl-CoA-carboxylase] ligase [Nocardioidaceae bacterium]